MSTRRRIVTAEPLTADKAPEITSLETRPLSESQLLMHFATEKELYFQIDSQVLIPDTMIDFSLFKQSGMQFIVILTASPAAPVKLSRELVNSLSRDTQAELVIERSSTPHYRAYLDALTESAPSLPEDVKLARKAFAIKENSKILLKDFLDSTSSSEKLEVVKDAVSDIVGLLLQNSAAVYDLLTLQKFDYYTYTHSVNVSVLSAALGAAIGLGKSDVVNLGMGAMLHDVGKTSVPSLILNKQGNLDPHEYKIIQGHVRRGGEILREHNAFPESAYDALLQHHEKLSGRGYPFKLRGQEINLFGRISGIADCYDALTTNRPYRSALSPYHALQIISQDIGDYDPDLLAAFVKMLGKRGRGST